MSLLEPLESRIAPASITFIDIDGITVKITSSKGSVADLQAVAILAAEGTGQELRELRLSDLPDVFQGANISIVKGTLSDTQFVNVGFVNAEGLDLGKVTIDGDLGRIVAGDDNSITPAAKDLTVGSFGVQGLDTQDGGTLVSKFLGRLASLTVNDDFKNASLTVLGIDPDPDEGISTAIDALGDIGNIFIGGDLIGGGETKTGYITAKGSIGNITIVGSVLAGSGDFSASISSERNMGKVDIGGDVQGGIIDGAAVSDFSGRIFSAGGMGSVKVGGALRGGDGVESGNISSAGVLGNVVIGQGIVGGAGKASGAVGTGGDIGKITILTGGILGGGGELSGSILSVGDMRAVDITGDVTGGSGLKSGIVAASGNLAKVTITGSVLGQSGVGSGAVGSLGNFAGITVTGNLIGGNGQDSGAIGCFGKLGPVSIGGEFTGGAQVGSGRIAAGISIDKVTIANSFTGGTQFEAGSIISPKIGSLSIGLDLVGGSAFRTGVVSVESIGKVSIGRDIKGGAGDNSGLITATKSVGNVTVTGSIFGGNGFSSGAIVTEFFGGSGGPLLDASARSAAAEPVESIGNVKIGGSLQGGSATRAGSIYSTGNIGGVTVGADVVGGTGFSAGVILANGNIGPVKITGDLKGDSEGTNGGRIRAFGKLASVNIGGDLIGGGGFYGDSTEGLSVRGQIASVGALGSVIISGNVLGGSGDSSAMINGGSIKSVLIGGDVQNGFGFESASVIASEGNLSSLTVKGSVNLVQNTQNEASNRVIFGAADSIGTATFGNLNGTGGFTEGLITAVNTIGKVTVENSAKFFKILAGYNTDTEPVNSKAKINKVIVGTTGAGDIQGVDIVAGVQASDNSGEGDGQFGTSDDTPISPFDSKNVSRIASVVIKGNVLPPGGFFSHNGIVAGQIDFVKIHGETVPLTSRLDVIEIGTLPVLDVLGGNGELSQFTVREVSFLLSTAP